MYVGIENSNEFYTHHYLAAIMAGDLKSAVFAKWSDDNDNADVRQPWNNLRGLNQGFFKLKEFFERETDVVTRVKRHQDFAAELLYALGYDPRPSLVPVDGGFLPTLAVINRPNGAPLLWCIPVVDSEPGEFADPLKLLLLREQYDAASLDSTNDELFNTTIEDVLSKQVLGAQEPPRFVLVLGESQILLLDRSKWAEKRLLRFDLLEILGRRDTDTLKATTALLHRESTCPPDGMSVLDTLDESSHKHAFGVSKDLKYALRESIELLGNEAVYYLRTVRKEKVFGTHIAGDLTLECLRYMYRLLFLFYIEARPELGYAPIQNDTYLKGYSVERLRDLEMMKLHTEEARQGFHIHDSLKLLFHLIYDGTTDRSQSLLPGVVADSYHGSFELFPLKSHLFDPERTPLLNKVRMRNEVMQRIINLMSLSQQGTGRNRRRGRISYAQLGINQLGSVYEALLSYRGFFAEEDLYEVKRAGDNYDPLETAYFVKLADLEKYTDEERVQIDGKFVVHDKGKFIYRLAGRDREKSASYYTPESLTQCLVKYALKELLEDEDGNVTKSADEILALTVCEPAMGSAAFLNEAVNQLSEAYLQQRQRELDVRIAHDDYALEKQKVKTYIADNNVFGVDLNPVAVELAEVSLWLNTIHEGGFVPWFGMQLCCGNSLIGARRQVFLPKHTKAKKKANLWLDKVPERIEPGAARPDGAIYHFLLGDDGMANYTDAVIKGKGGKNPIKGLAEDEVAAITEWRKEFNQPLDADDRHTLVELSAAIDRLWDRHTEMLRDIRRRTTDDYVVWGVSGQTESGRRGERVTTTRQKDGIWHGELFSEGVRASSPYRRLKMVMDYWCALWFWPIDKADELPSRDEFLFELGLLLGTDVLQSRTEDTQSDIFAPTVSEADGQAMVDEYGFVDVDALKKRHTRLSIVDVLAARHCFLHWELEFSDLFDARGGFDLIVGNPPWIKVEWNEAGVMGDADPFFVLRNLSASKLAALRENTLERLSLRPAYLAAYEDADATKNYLNKVQNYPELKGVQTNLYKCFITLGWQLTARSGHFGFIHPEGCYDDPKGGHLRAEILQRLRAHFQFVNEHNLFEIHHLVKFSISIYGPVQSAQIKSISNLFTAKTIDDSFAHHGLGPVPGIKDDEGNWDVRGHASRIVEVDEDTLALFAKLYDPPGTPAIEARLPVVHSREILEVLRKLADAPRKLGDLEGQYFSTVCFDETYAQRDGTICRETRFPKDVSEWIVSGPHFYVGTPFNKTPRAECNHNQAYDVIDLTAIPDDYLPRTNYVPACDPNEYRRRTPHWNGRPITDFYRHVHREMVAPTGERTLVPILLPPGAAHVNTLLCLAHQHLGTLTMVSAAAASVVADFFMKSTGMGHINTNLAKQLPVLAQEPFTLLRFLRLNCLTTHYADIWAKLYIAAFREQKWGKDDSRLGQLGDVGPEWSRNVGLQLAYQRRQALVEIDVLVAMELGLSLDALKTIYRVQFPVLRQYENDTWYDQTGRVVFTTNRGQVGVGLRRRRDATDPDNPSWEEVCDMTSGTVEQSIIDDTMPGGPVERTITYVAPFDKCDREEDYAVAWAEFERRYGKVGTRTHPVPDVPTEVERESELTAVTETVDSISQESVIVPQANSAETLSRLMLNIDAGIASSDPLGTTLGVEGRTVHYYLELAEWLGWIERSHGAFSMTAVGESFVEGARPKVFRDSLMKQLLIRRAGELHEQAQIDLGDALVQAILELSDLGESTARRRASALRSLIRAAQAPDDVDWGIVDEPAVESTLDEATSWVEPSEASFSRLSEATDLFETTDAEELPAGTDIAALDPPRLLLPTLVKFHVHAIRDLIELDLEEVRKARGFGRKKFKLLQELQQEARARRGNVPDEVSEASNNTWDLVKPTERWDALLPRLSNRAQNALAANDVTTLEELQSMLGHLSRLSGIGQKTANEIRQAFEDLTTRGRTYMLFGDAPPPRTIDELLERALDEFEPRGRRFAVQWRLEGATLEEVGNSAGLTRERVRQVVSKRLEEIRPIYRPYAADILAPELSMLERPGNLLVCEDEDEARKLDLILELAGTDPSRSGRVLTTRTPDEAREQRRELRDALEANGKRTMAIDDALDVADEIGIIIEPAELVRLLQDSWKIGLTPDGRLVFPWLNLGEVLAEQLLKLGVAADVRQILDAYDALRQTPTGGELPEMNEHSARSHLGRTDVVWNYGHGLYIHEDSLPFPKAELDRVTAWALNRLQGSTDSIGANVLLDEMNAQRVAPAGLTAHLIKDCVYRHPDGLTFQNTLLVAHAGSLTEDGVTMIDRLVNTVDSFDDFAPTAAIQEAMDHWGYASTTVYQTLLASPLFVNLGRGRFITLASLNLGDALDALGDTALEVLGNSNVMPTTDLLAALPRTMAEPLAQLAEPEAVLEALARRDERLDVSFGIIGRSGAHGALNTAILEVIDDFGCAYPREIRASLVETYGDRMVERNVWRALSLLQENQVLEKLPGALYFRPSDERTVWNAWGWRRDVVVKTATHADFDTHDPNILWSLIRYIERIVDDDPLALQLMANLNVREDIPDEIKNEINELRFALSMGMG